jgi:hypothetical protein
MKRYAAYFGDRDREQAELGVAEEVIRSLELGGLRQLTNLSSNRPDPPDCICVNEAGDRVAIEVSEVVCADAARLNAHGHDVYRDWQPGEFCDRISLQLATKDSKQFHGGPYAEIVACLFTDEPIMNSDRVAKELENALFGPFRQLTSAYLVLSYDPATKGYPLYVLPFQPAA